MKTQQFRRLGLPYCLQRCKDGRWLVLNRNYKPVGSTSDDWVDYDTCPGIRLKLSAARLKKLSWNPDADIKAQVWLYNDGRIPRHSKKHQANYAERLMLLIDSEAPK